MSGVCGRRHGAFTLTELMVSIGVLATLVAIMLPALGGARGEAAQIASLSNARQLGGVIAMYAERSRGLYPCLIEGRFYPTTGGVGNPQFSYPYWQVWHVWTGVVFDELPYGENVGVYVSPTSSRLRDVGIPWPTSYAYSTSFVGDPGLWRPGAIAEQHLRRGTRLHEVHFPSSKALLWDAEVSWLPSPRVDAEDNLQEPTPVILADTSGSIRKPIEATPAVPNPFDHPLRLARLHNTSNGVHGRDY